MVRSLRMDANRFVFAVCQPGSERALKHEVAREHPDLRFAYSQPGLVTFKRTLDGDLDYPLRSVFTRAFGASFGAGSDPAAILAHAAGFPSPLRLHVFDHDDASDAAATLEAAIRAAAPSSRFHADPVARPGDLVLDVIVAAGRPPWVGIHTHSAATSSFPGGRFPIEVPATAPSRAYAKLEEALAWSGLPVRTGQIAVEVGSAPGGATFALLRRGLEVVGVDPGAMAAIVAADPRFRHVAKPMGDVRREDLPARVDWLLLDVNLAPQVALHAIRRLVAYLKPGLRGVIFTLKLNDWKASVEVPSLLSRVGAMGLT